MMALVTGGASGGKSAFAEALTVALGSQPLYLATMRPFGEEGGRRVKRHRAQRAGKGFATVECYGNLESLLDSGRLDGMTVLFEDLANYVANELFDGAGPCGSSAAGDDLAQLALRARHLVVVGNELGCDGYLYDLETRAYRQELGRAACEVAAMSDAVVECVAGIPSALKKPVRDEPCAGFALVRTLEAYRGRS